MDKNDNRVVKAVKVVNKETKEIELFIHSKAKELKEQAIQTRIQNIFIEKLQYLKDGLSIKRRTKEYEKVLIAIGRLKEEMKMSRKRRNFTAEFKSGYFSSN